MHTAGALGEKPRTTVLGSLMGLVLVPVLAFGALLALPSVFVARWIRGFRERSFRARVRASGRGISWQQFRRSMNEQGGTCIEERFSPRGLVRFWWTPEDVYAQSPHEITSWFAMRKGGRFAPFIHWCRQRYTCAEKGSAQLIETFGVPQKEIYTLWSECRSEHSTARWVEVPPPEILAIQAEPASAPQSISPD